MRNRFKLLASLVLLGAYGCDNSVNILDMDLPGDEDVINEITALLDNESAEIKLSKTDHHHWLMRSLQWDKSPPEAIL